MTMGQDEGAPLEVPNPNLFRRVMASFATGVTIITTSSAGEIRGMTANAFMSGSLDPPLCVVSIAKKARMHAILEEAGHFGVNILSHDQDTLVGHFAGRPVEDFLPDYDYADETPVLSRACATIAATVAERYECGDHTLFVGHIFKMRVNENAAPLVFQAGRIASLRPSQRLWPLGAFW
jgi:flavin reductase (DIM6/NTAB) family NADH-FMN oxidoreductase RutF